MSQARARSDRPLSPHLQIYKPIPTMMMSIVHRATGVALYLGSLLVAWWFAAIAAGEAYFDFVNGLLVSWPGRIILLGFTWALIHHAIGGVLHLVRDTGRALEKTFATRMAWLKPVLSIVVTIIIWLIAYLVH